MYLYILSIHSGEKAEPKADSKKGRMEFPIEKQKGDRLHFANSAPTLIPSWDLRGNLEVGTGAPHLKETETLGTRLWYSKHAIEPSVLEMALKHAYTFGFGKYSQIENITYTLDTRYNSNDINHLNEINEIAFHFCATRVELPDGMNAALAEEELVSFWDASGVKLSLEPKSAYFKDTSSPVKIPYMRPPREFRTLEDIHRFAEYIASLNTMEKAKMAWRNNTRHSSETICGYEEAHDDACFLENFDDTFINNKQKEVEDRKSPNRILILKQAHDGKVIKRALMPCDTTPWLGTTLLPEFGIVKAVNWTPSVGYMDEDTLEALTLGLKVTESESIIVPAYRDMDTERETNTKKPVTNTSESYTFPYQEDLDTLWKIFNTEYIQRPNHKNGPRRAAIPNSILIAVWKILALQPKGCPASMNPVYEDSIISKKDLPKNWRKVITLEVLTEYFYANVKDKNYENCILYSFNSGFFISTLFRLYNNTMPITNDIDWSTVPVMDPTPLLLAITNPSALTEDHKKVWIANFVNIHMEKKEKGVSGSQETYDDFVSWVKTGAYMKGLVSNAIRTEFVSQFPIAEFAGLMKENGIAMTRRSRGMVYVGFTLRSKSDDDWTMNSTDRVPTEGEIMPTLSLGEPSGVDTILGVDNPFENSWAAPV